MDSQEKYREILEQYCKEIKDGGYDDGKFYFKFMIFTIFENSVEMRKWSYDIEDGEEILFQIPDKLQMFFESLT